MKIKPKQYAEVLFEFLKDADEKKTEKILSKFVEVLIFNNNISQFDKIVYFFDQIWNKNKKILPVQIVSARKLEQKYINELTKYFKNISNLDVELKFQADETLKGGFILRYGDKSADYSLRNKLRQFKTALIK